MRDLDVELLNALNEIIPEPETVSENDTRTVEVKQTKRRTKK